MLFPSAFHKELQGRNMISNGQAMGQTFRVKKSINGAKVCTLGSRYSGAEP